MSIRIAGLVKKFGETTVLPGLDLDVATGELLVLLGPSGCGKTTTMRCVAGLETPTAGSISIGDVTVFDQARHIDVPIEERRVGMVFQSYAIWPHMTVFENVAFPLQIAGVAKAEARERVGEMLSLVGLETYADRGASYLSGGQMQRVALARSLIHQPAVLLMDEPLSNLDARLRDRLRVLLRELQTRFKTTALYVTHDQQEALALADRIVVLDAGTILQTGAPEDLYRSPRSRTVADFLGYGNIFEVSPLPQAPGSVRLEASGQTLAAALVPKGASAYAACVRPNDVRLAMLDGGAGAARPANTLRGTIVMASFQGSFVHYRVRSEGLVWDVHSVNPPPVHVDDDVLLSVAPEHVLVVPAT
ncbi:MAG TPA: ABC transporter ATP-binding protein [Candidatus Lustribacter sp.]